MGPWRGGGLCLLSLEKVGTRWIGRFTGLAVSRSLAEEKAQAEGLRVADVEVDQGLAVGGVVGTEVSS